MQFNLNIYTYDQSHKNINNLIAHYKIINIAVLLHLILSFNLTSMINNF